MRKIVHYVKEYDPKVKLLCGCRDGFIQHNGEDVTCKRCIKSLRARGQPFKRQKEFRDPTQNDLFNHRERFMGFKTKVSKILSIWIAWFKSKFRRKSKTLYAKEISIRIGDKKYSWPDGIEISQGYEIEVQSEDGSLARP